jgi:predicted DNA-binding mobile mystery protein A
MRSTQSRAARRALDRRLSQLPPAAAFASPARGWIRAVREALGMSAADLAARLQVTQPSVRDIERSESAHRIRLDTLERAAEAMGCTLVYALIPRGGSLAQIVEQQAQAQIGDQVRAVSRAMDLEAQGTRIDDEVIREEMQRFIDSGRLWK